MKLPKVLRQPFVYIFSIIVDALLVAFADGSWPGLLFGNFIGLAILTLGYNLLHWSRNGNSSR